MGTLTYQRTVLLPLEVPPIERSSVASMFSLNLKALNLVTATRWYHQLLVRCLSLHKGITLVKQTDGKWHAFQYSQHHLFSHAKGLNKMKATVWDHQQFSNEGWGFPWYFWCCSELVHLFYDQLFPVPVFHWNASSVLISQLFFLANTV